MRTKGSTKELTKYDNVIVPHLSDIKQWIMEGVTDRQICERLELSPDTWYRYMREHPILSDIVKIYKETMDDEVEKALIKAAMGYDYEEVRTVIEEDKNGKKRTRIEKVKKHQPSNPTAMIFWLKNRRPELWSDRREIILDTKAQEEERKKLFLDMINENEVPADYEVSEETTDVDAEDSEA
ncbi:transposase [Clostridium pasteurianum]|uniref:transposase n=1 Tax=Clostridium pasteurianum TaxID=1501 RepID=UPI002260DFC5|nr:transposase [Clostridium pasteurianum]UZW12580.1 transposase [Clostridium pasteurianum]